MDTETAIPDSVFAVANSTLLLTRIRSGNVYEETVERILQTIKLGFASPGQKLPAERDLAGLMGVSRDTVRVAISSLVEAGFLEISRGRYGGTFVSASLPEEVRSQAKFESKVLEEAILFREVVECGAAYQSAKSELSSNQQKALHQAHRETTLSSAADYRRFDSRFHLLIAESCGSSKLLEEVAFSRSRINEMLDQIPLLPPNIEHSNEQHREILEAIISRNPTLASELMRTHLEGSAALLRGFLS